MSTQFEIIAYDSFYPNDRATATVTVNVNRNPDAPRFANNELNYRISIDETQKVGTTVLDINATDTDGVSYKISCEGRVLKQNN